MTDFDLDQLGDVWRQQPDPKEIEALKRTAAIVSRRARLSELVDTLAALIVACAVVALVALTPRIDTVLIGVAVILFLFWSETRKRRLRSIEIKSLTGTVEDMLTQSIERVEARQKHIRLTAIFAAPALSLGLAFAYVIDRSSEGTLLPQVEGGSPVAIAINVIVAVGLVLGTIHFAKAYRNNRKELERLRSLRQAYRQEQPSEPFE